jgi:indolepyruvate ferredoxin oxidoreductase alpha subunit
MVSHGILAPPGTRVALMGNEAIARGLIEADARVVVGYPGTPSSEVIMTLQSISRQLGMYVEWAINERVAFEIALGASIAGVRAMATMKAPGLNVASDPLLSSAYCGVNRGLVVLVADDPGPHTTQTEQDSRWYAKLAKLPMISPSNPQEAKDFTKVAFDISEELELPVILRTTTRVNHTVSDVVLGERVEVAQKPTLVKDEVRFVRAGMSWNLERRKWLNSRLKLAEEIASKYKINTSTGTGDFCIVTEGVAYEYVIEALEELDLLDKARVVKLGLLYPTPKKFLLENLADCKAVLVVEELDPYIEELVKMTLYEGNLNTRIYGKSTEHTPLEGELNKHIVKSTLVNLIEEKAFTKSGVIESSHSVLGEIPPRPPPLCPGCPHRFSFLALKTAISKKGYKLSEIPVFGDIGCYALAVYPPLSMLWTEHSMGASISMAIGAKIAGYSKPVVAVIGDSTFHHAGIQPLIEAVNKNVDVLIMILDNDVVAMTGHQSTPAWSVSESGRVLRPVSVESIVKAVNPDIVVTIDPYNLDEMISIISELVDKPGVKVVIAKHPCALLERRKRRATRKYRVDPSTCKGCKACINVTGCPAIVVEDSVARIISEDCNGCGLCSRYCPYKAIKPVEEAVVE